MKSINYKAESFFLLLLIIPFIYCASVWSTLPTTIPTHFDSLGNIDGWGDKIYIFMLPIINILMYLFLLWFANSNAQKIGNDFLRKNFYKLRVINTILISALALGFVIVAQLA